MSPISRGETSQPAGCHVWNTLHHPSTTSAAGSRRLNRDAIA